MITTDRFVTHISTVPATRGQTVGLFVREKALAATLEQRKPHVVLMVHGGFAPSIVAYDLQYRDYSFMSAMARAGFDPTHGAEAMAVLARTVKSQKFLPALLRSHPLT